MKCASCDQSPLIHPASFRTFFDVGECGGTAKFGGGDEALERTEELIVDLDTTVHKLCNTQMEYQLSIDVSLRGAF